jgi:hypothetical protein
MALVARRAPDIIMRDSIPLSATSDAPVVEPPRPPENASGHPDDQAQGIAHEITPEEQAVALAQRKGDPATAADQPADGDTPQPDAEDFTDGIEVSPELARNTQLSKQVAKIRKQAREAVEKVMAATKAQVGDETWTEAWEAANRAATHKYRQALEKAEAEQRRLAEQLAERDAELAKVKTEPKVEADSQPEPRPRRDQFDDPDEYEDALLAWRDKENTRAVEAKAKADKAEADRVKAETEAAARAEEERKAREANEAEMAKVHEAWVEAETAAVAKYPDYQEVVKREPEDGGPTISDAMMGALMKCGNGTDVAYYLAANTELSEEIAKNPNPILQVAEVFRLAGRLQERQTRPAARRAAPITPVNQRQSPPEVVNPDDEPIESYYARRTKETVGERRPFFPAGGIH